MAAMVNRTEPTPDYFLGSASLSYKKTLRIRMAARHGGIYL
jgi:hypothetical protein